jgi:superfamily II DNA/RNA helicase
MEYPIAIDDVVKARLEKSGIDQAYEIQILAATPVYEGQDVKIFAPTGSGKTLSYLLPLAAKLAEEKDMRLLILTSSPELASQIQSVFKQYFEEFSSLLILGSANINRQKDRLKKKPRVIVGTPGRVFELFCLECFSVTEETTVVLDEIDTLLERASYDKVLSLVEGCSQLVSASATYGDVADSFLKETPFQLQEVSTEKREGVVKHSYVFCNANKKDITLIKLLRQEKLKKVLLFINDLKYGSHLAKRLMDSDIKCSRLDAKIQKLDREKAIKAFRDETIQVLIASDSLSRGVDFKDANVVQYNIAREKELYIHRSGRAGRAGSTGRCISMVTDKDAHIVKKQQKAISIVIEELKLISAGSGKPFRKSKPTKKKK